MEEFVAANEDGTGSVYIKDGKFVVNKWPLDLDTVLKQKLPLFDHMPYDGWTLAHVRAISHGKKSVRNTHPFVKGEWAMAHNGIFHEYAPVKAVLQTLGKFEGETDSEVAATLWQVVGRQKFIESLDRSGVFMFLKNNGQLDVVCCTGGDLQFQKTKYGILMASELAHDKYRRSHTVLEGSFKLSKKGNFIHANWEKDEGANWGYMSPSHWAVDYNDWEDDDDLDIDKKYKSKPKIVSYSWGNRHIAYD